MQANVFVQLADRIRSGAKSRLVMGNPVCNLASLCLKLFIFFRSTGRPKELLLTSALMTFLFLILGSVATPLLGVRGLFLALAAASFVSLGFQIRWVRRTQVL